MGLNTVLRFSRATEPEQLFTGQWQSCPTKLDAYKPYLDQRWQEGCTNAWKLREEIKAQGSPDGYGNVRAYVSRNLRGKPKPVGPRPSSAHAVTRWILTHPDALAESDRLQLEAVSANCPELDALAEHVRFFACMPTQLQGHQLPTWIEAATAADLPSLQRFAGTWSAASTPSLPDSRSRGTPGSSKAMSTGSRCSSARCPAAQASNSSASASCSTPEFAVQSSAPGEDSSSSAARVTWAVHDQGSRGGSQLTSTSVSWKARTSSVTITAAAARASCGSVLIGTPSRPQSIPLSVRKLVRQPSGVANRTIPFGMPQAGRCFSFLRPTTPLFNIVESIGDERGWRINRRDAVRCLPRTAS
ncbi:hypothetical protein [Streptomyces sp. 13-12-16]|uniref:hypothetical protein n=1 Tax=Streptomyces sp. 13-12-16 TaxID=1570823 RepID=UPI001C4F7BA4|nr:hypothetical protein [Streptomyces sp. 13-12-16]